MTGIRPEIAALAVSIDSIEPHPSNIRQGDIGAICQSLHHHGQYRPIVVQRSTGQILAGNHTYHAARSLGWPEIAATFVECDDDQALRILLVDNRANDLATYDDAALVDLLRQLAATDLGLDGTLFDGDALDQLITDITTDVPRSSLADQFGVPPFSVFDCRQGYWQARKEMWRSMGIKSEIGRGKNMLDMGHLGADLSRADYEKWQGEMAQATKTQGFIDGGYVKEGSILAEGTSIFDPVLTEMMVRWFSPVGGTIIDPFAGGSVRGIVSAISGRTYHGTDLAAEQIAANYVQSETIITGSQQKPSWVCGDSRDITTLLAGITGDMLLTCPPYGDLEVYSDDPADISQMTHADFLTAYQIIITESMSLLRDDSFAVFVVGDYRDKHGMYRNFVSDTIAAVQATGAHLYNEAILVQAVGTAGIRAGQYMKAGRKLVKMHQNVLIFIKGNPKKATARCGDIDIADSWVQ